MRWFEFSTSRILSPGYMGAGQTMEETASDMDGWDEVPNIGDGTTFCRVPGFVMQYGIWADMRPSEAMLFVALCQYANRKQGYRAWASGRTLAKVSGLNEESVRIAKKGLKMRGLITDGFHRSSGRYSIWVAARGPHHFSDACKRDRMENQNES
jgi:hypothetical protein